GARPPATQPARRVHAVRSVAHEPAVLNAPLAPALHNFARGLFARGALAAGDATHGLASTFAPSDVLHRVPRADRSTPARTAPSGTGASDAGAHDNSRARIGGAARGAASRHASRDARTHGEIRARAHALSLIPLRAAPRADAPERDLRRDESLKGSVTRAAGGAARHEGRAAVHERNAPRGVLPMRR